MRAAAICLTFGRASLPELLACIARQSYPLRTLLYVDDAPELVIEAPPLVEVVHGMRSSLSSLGPVRARAVEAARACFDLSGRDAIVLLDDDDFYSSQHFEVSIEALERAPGGWTGALAMGLTLDGGEPVFVNAHGGVGQHATWAMRLERYDEAGGYQDVRPEDVSLGRALGWETCSPHWHVTHVRRQHSASLSSELVGHDCAKLRRLAGLVAGPVRQQWSAECERLERWCAAQD